MSVVRDFTPDELWSWRSVLFVESTLALLLAGAAFGHFARRWHWPLRILGLGGLGLLFYLMIGQIKAFNLMVRVDAVSHVGVAVYALFIVGLLAVRHRERSSPKGA